MDVKKVYISCPICGERFPVESKRGRPKKYCSEACKEKAKNIRRKKNRQFSKKCKYCGKTFIGNKKTVYCCKECAKKSKQDYDMHYAFHKYHTNTEYRRKKREKSIGTINLSENLDEEGNRDWGKEYKMILALKKQAGLK